MAQCYILLNNYNNEEDKDNDNVDDGTVALVSSRAHVERFIFESA